MSYWEERCREFEEPGKVIEELRAEVARLTAELTEAREAMRLATLALGSEPVHAPNVRPIHIRDDGQVCEMTGEPIVMPGLEPEHILAAMEDVKAGRLKSLAQIVAERNAKFEPPKHATSTAESFESLRKAGGNAWDRVAHVGEYLGRKGDPEPPRHAPCRIVVALSNLLEHAQGAFDEVNTLGGHCIRHSKTEGFQAAIEAAGKALRLAEPAVE